jgi:tRNA pseudouridine55 synthase
MATGVLVVGIGSGTKALQQFLGGWKEYEAVCVFGTVTDSYDAVGKVLRRGGTVQVTREKATETLSQFYGEIEQMPPM